MGCGASTPTNGAGPISPAPAVKKANANQPLGFNNQQQSEGGGGALKQQQQQQQKQQQQQQQVERVALDDAAAAVGWCSLNPV